MRIENKELAISLKPERQSPQVVKKACQDFEAFFLGFIFKKAFNPFLLLLPLLFLVRRKPGFGRCGWMKLLKKLGKMGAGACLTCFIEN